MTYGWEGERVRLVPLDRERHLDAAVAWLNDSEATAWTLVGDLPLTRLAEETFFEKASQPGGDEIHFAVETLDGEHIGFCGLTKIDWPNGVAQTGTIIGAAANRGHGFGSDAIRIRTRYAFETLGLRLLLTEVMSENTASLKALEKVGYREIGRIPGRLWKRGAYRDLTLLMLDRESWRP